MRVRTLSLLLVLVAIGAFAVLNWGVFLAPTTLNLGVADVHAPLGLVMLILLAFVIVLFLGYLVYLQSAMLLEARCNARELQANRGLAEKAEASRFTELRGFLDLELKKLASLDLESKTAVMNRIDTLEQGLRLMIEQTGNSVSAQIGELEDRLETGARSLKLPPPA